MKIQKGNITSRIELSPGEDVGIHPIHTLNFTNVDALNIQDNLRIPLAAFFQGLINTLSMTPTGTKPTSFLTAALPSCLT